MAIALALLLAVAAVIAVAFECEVAAGVLFGLAVIVANGLI